MTKIDRSKNYNPKKIGSAFENNYTGYKSDGNKKLSMIKYLDKIRSYLYDMIDTLEHPSGERKICLTKQIRCILRLITQKIWLIMIQMK